MKISAILLAGGKGTRMGNSSPKQYLPLAGKPIALHSFDLFRSSNKISEIIVTCQVRYEECFKSCCNFVKFARPGTRRQDSLLNALEKVSADCDYILVHDAARPLLLEENLNKVISAAKEYGAATLATPIISTVKEADEKLIVKRTLSRSGLYEIQTPQVIKKVLLEKGFEQAQKNNLTVTDDVSLVELISHPVKLALGSKENIKITTPEDLIAAENILLNRFEFITQI